MSSLGSIAVFAAYQLNKDYISAFLCENAPKGDKKCHGQCHLQKELKKEAQKENAPINPVKEKYEVQFFYQQKISTPTEAGFTSNIFSHYHFNIHLAPAAAIFQPPKV